MSNCIFIKYLISGIPIKNLVYIYSPVYVEIIIRPFLPVELFYIVTLNMNHTVRVCISIETRYMYVLVLKLGTLLKCGVQQSAA